MCPPCPDPEFTHHLFTRRGLLVTAAEASLVAAAGSVILTSATAPSSAAVPMSRVDAIVSGITRTWLAPQYWANRLADWRLTQWPDRGADRRRRRPDRWCV